MAEDPVPCPSCAAHWQALRLSSLWTVWNLHPFLSRITPIVCFRPDNPERHYRANDHVSVYGRSAKKANYLDISIRIATAAWDAIRRDDPLGDEVVVYTLNGGVTQRFTGSVQGELLVLLDGLVVFALPCILELALRHATTGVHGHHLLQESNDLLAFCGKIMPDKRAGPVAVVALIVAILWLKLLVKVTEKEHASTIRFIATISSDT